MNSCCFILLLSRAAIIILFGVAKQKPVELKPNREATEGRPSRAAPNKATFSTQVCHLTERSRLSTPTPAASSVPPRAHRQDFVDSQAACSSLAALAHASLSLAQAAVRLGRGGLRTPAGERGGPPGGQEAGYRKPADEERGSRDHGGESRSKKTLSD